MVGKTPANPTLVAQKVILLVDDHPILRNGIEALLKQHQPELVCVQADSSLAALKSVEDFRPNVAIVDVALGDADGIALVARMKAQLPDLAVVALSMHDEPLYVLRAFKAGARGYVIKTDPPRDLFEAMRAAVDGGIFLSTRLRRTPVFKVLSGAESMMGQLTTREAEVLLMMGKGNGTSSIARDLGLSVKTIETYQGHIKEKLGLANGKEMVEFATDLVTYREMP